MTTTPDPPFIQEVKSVSVSNVLFDDKDESLNSNVVPNSPVQQNQMELSVGNEQDEKNESKVGTEVKADPDDEEGFKTPTTKESKIPITECPNAPTRKRTRVEGILALISAKESCGSLVVSVDNPDDVDDKEDEDQSGEVQSPLARSLSFDAHAKVCPNLKKGRIA